METTYIRETSLRYGRKAEKKHVGQAGDVARLFRKVVKDNTREHFVVFHLDGAHEVVAYTIAHIGSANFCQVHPREVFQAAILSGAVAVIVAHNHPSGCISPSPEDMRMTARLEEAGRILGIKLLDSLVITDDSYHPVAA